METVATFVTMATGTLELVKTGISLMMEPPVVYFVALSALGVGIKMAKSFVPRKK